MLMTNERKKTYIMMNIHWKSLQKGKKKESSKDSLLEEETDEQKKAKSKEK